MISPEDVLKVDSGEIDNEERENIIKICDAIVVKFEEAIQNISTRKSFNKSVYIEVSDFEQSFDIRKNIVYNVYEDCVNIPIPIFNADDVQIGDRFTIINHPFNKGAIIIRAFDLEDKDIYSASLNSVGMGNKEYSKYVFDIIRPEQLPNPLVFLNHRRPDVVIYERMEA